MDKLLSFSFIVATILFGLYGQLVLKWQVNIAGPPPVDWVGRVEYVGGLLRNPWVWSTVAAAFLGMLFWMLALSKADLSYAYPFTSLSFVLILIASAMLFNEPITGTKLAGMFLIIAGLIVGSR